MMEAMKCFMIGGYGCMCVCIKNLQCVVHLVGADR